VESWSRVWSLTFELNLELNFWSENLESDLGVGFGLSFEIFIIQHDNDILSLFVAVMGSNIIVNIVITLCNKHV